ncbi:carbohydrate ABC transporter permease [Evansella cellulosilytica]|uniref:Binding-protein-dependent transport systems inner membrane component n=1 Tax=Evansella cellulosilytica (strain ATCC 21833 / DSM 2522 / FERM P-1141 / JCM 9156 / N-4) TaxID=649639 RepID=E6U0G7_EVAC2|nr:sugar ABC transporter permease [Evansella cellulosilytica]ADU31412.1 binding-protein-dependent transport systems inner membrane component [Evansella cellulosilytica DSM 2522]
MHLLKRPWKIGLGILPALAIYSIFSIVPIFISIYYSFHSWNGFSPMQFVGLRNYLNLLTDSIFWASLRNNLLVVLASVFGQIPIALGLALLLNRKIKGAKFFRTIGFLPVVISTVVISITWRMMYNSEYGMINNFLESIGLGFLRQNWLGNPDIAMYAVCIVIIWQFIGLYFIIFLSALQTVPKDIIEAAELDGASEWQKTRHIILPSIWNVILVAIVLCISGSLKTFDLIFVMTGGGPAHTTEVMATYMYVETFQGLRYGYGSAISVLILIFSLILIIINMKFLSRKDA